jgi:2-polyprenyl-3-methyl-5-hydroxy-6-metoxy-1,4-benzoquinol methylase
MVSSASIGFPGQDVSSTAADLKLAACPLCGALDAAPQFTQRKHTLMRCGECDLSFIHPYPNADEHHTVVSEYDYPELEVLRSEAQYKNEVLFYTRYFDLIDSECQEASSILDGGCGCGHLLERLASRRKLVRAGIELNRERAKFARSVARCEILEVPVEKLDCARRFEVITLMNVLSHIPDIGQLFEKLRGLLAERGKVIVKTGEMKRDVKKSAIFDWEFPDHLHFLGWRTMDYISAKYGLRVRKHLRNSLANERFAAATWKMQGRSGVRNAIKTTLAHLPFALPLLARCYEAVHKGSVSSSFIVLEAEQGLAGRPTLQAV